MKNVKNKDTVKMISDNLYHIIANRNPDSSCILATVLNGKHQGQRRLWIDNIVRWSNTRDTFFEKYEAVITEISGSQLVELEDSQVFCERIGTRKNLVICGAGHVSIPIIELGKKVGFHVTVIDDRPFFANNARRADADVVICDNFEKAMNGIKGSQDTYFVMVTRGHRYDMDCLRIALTKPNAYIGMMGSRKRVGIIMKQLMEEGVSPKKLEEVHSPIGLNIGAETPDEIAISIMAEIIQEKNAQKRISSYDEELLFHLIDPNHSAKKSVLCTIVAKKGSAPREIGTKMLVLEDGTTVGTIGGGCAESNIIQQSLKMMRNANSSFDLEMVDMLGKEAEDAGMVCGGKILVYMEGINIRKKENKIRVTK
jgi:xanthine dehydrogenase accessory factor